ncbi:protein kinase [Gordonia sp. ABSL1-1]|uniref:serine/threonine-protein kinase n=1 Tax=Gordonia sp. ABSL1-1 TaxID=3053923 RepID=UPI002572E76E|nr:serine/threonine-protein kinase [Gordonia sp. ABSL1-1]MDL9938463.1 protein kinase [Gordonia sp. ABSL1-1]
MSDERVTRQFGPYRLDKLLGRGGMGEVYRAYDTVKDRVVALKLLNAGLATDSMYQERFRRESHAAARLGEPHVIPIHDWGQIDGVLFIDMRLVEGEDLRALLKREHRLDPSRAVAIVAQVASALDAAHAQRLVHRDVKPENILVGADDFAYLVDFGIAHAADDTHLTQAGTAIGSVAYMAPELFDDAEITAAADIYALSCVLFECLTGQVPHPADSVSASLMAALSGPPPAPSSVNVDVPAAFDPVIGRGLALDPAQRFHRASDLARAAHAALVAPTQPVSAPPTITPARPSINPAPPTVTAAPAGQAWPQQTGSDPTLRVPGLPPRTVTPAAGVPTASGPVGYPPPPSSYPPARQKNSPVMPILFGVIAVAIIGVVVLGGILLFGRGGDDSSDTPAASTSTVTKVVPGGETPSTPASESPVTPVTPPPGSVPCDSTVGIGTQVTSCSFAAAVRDAYLRSGPKGTARVVTAYSPVTSQSYQMSCAPESGIVICRGGNDAVVHIY